MMGTANLRSSRASAHRASLRRRDDGTAMLRRRSFSFALTKESFRAISSVTYAATVAPENEKWSGFVWKASAIVGDPANSLVFGRKHAAGYPG